MLKVVTLGLTASLSVVSGTVGVSRVGSLQECDRELIEETRIGSIEGPVEYAFGEINSLAAGELGTVYVSDTHPASIRQFTPNGQFVRWIGREGEGPGEYGSIAGVSVLPDGRLAAWDRSNRRITVYSVDGEYEDAIRVDAVRPPYPYVDRAFLTDLAGRFYLRIFIQPPSPGPDPIAAASVRYGYARVSPEGVVIDTVRAPEVERQRTLESIMIHTRAGARSPFPEGTLDAMSPFGYLVAGFNEAYAFSILDPSGTISVEKEGFQPVAVTRGERAEWRVRVAHVERRSGQSFQDVPAWKPAYRDLWVDADGRIWIHRYAEAVQRDEPIAELWLNGDEPRITWMEPVLYDVYGPDGRLLHCVAAPEDTELVTSRGSFVWGIARGALDEEYVVRWRIPTESRSSGR